MSESVNSCIVNNALLFRFRPVAGYVNMCPTQLSIKPEDVRSSISTFIHEMAHALVSYLFIDSSFISYLECKDWCTDAFVVISTCIRVMVYVVLAD